MLSLSSCAQVRVSRGDTCDIEVVINQGTAMDPFRYDLQPNDEIYFGLMEPNQPFEYAILKKKLTYDDVIDNQQFIHLEPKDTLCLLPGLYYYQIKVRIYDAVNQRYIVNTIIPKTQFWIEE